MLVSTAGVLGSRSIITAPGVGVFPLPSLSFVNILPRLAANPVVTAETVLVLAIGPIGTFITNTVVSFLPRLSVAITQIESLPPVAFGFAV